VRGGGRPATFRTLFQPHRNSASRSGTLRKSFYCSHMPVDCANCNSYRAIPPGGSVRSGVTLAFMNGAQTCIHSIGQFVQVHDFRMCLDSRADKTFPMKDGSHDGNLPNLPGLAQSGVCQRTQERGTTVESWFV
jgi:hypothetical protein